MRSTRWARWATCALAISVCVPAALADRHTRQSIADCTGFDQADKGDDAVQFTIHNGCSIKLDCAISWRVVCAPDTKQATAHDASKKLALLADKTEATEASAAVCGEKDWAIKQIEWSCEPNKD